MGISGLFEPSKIKQNNSNEIFLNLSNYMISVVCCCVGFFLINLKKKQPKRYIILFLLERFQWIKFYPEYLDGKVRWGLSLQIDKKYFAMAALLVGIIWLLLWSVISPFFNTWCERLFSHNTNNECWYNTISQKSL